MGTEERASILPAGTVTFLLADIDVPAGAADGLRQRARTVVDLAVAGHGGQPAEPTADGGQGSVHTVHTVLAVFASAADAVAAALDVQRAVAAEPWPSPSGSQAAAAVAAPPAVRVGLHTGEALLRDDREYTGAALQRAVRICDVAHGGQVLLSSVTAALVADDLPPGTWVDDLGAHRLRDLSRPERVMALRHSDLPGDFPPLRSLDTLANNLPIQLTSFVGRSGELAAVQLLLDSERLVTLTGSGGCGKTRLAVQAAAELADRWPDGVWWVDLAPVSDPALVPEMVASAIGVLVEPVGGPMRALSLQLSDRRLLVCLDNCEHLLESCAELAEALLVACPEVSVLATSREPLGVAGEIVWRVPSMAEDEAVSLFVDRAGRVRPWFTLDDTSEAAVRTLCRRLDGIPLAIELAAAWLRTLTPAQIAAGLDDRFALLVRGPRGAMARQQTLVASIDWSHDLLDDTDRVVFRRLAVFAGDFTLDAARAVGAADPVGEGDVLVALGRLVDKSLVVMDEHGGEARYRLLETIRQYAQDRLDAAGETAAARDRHLDHFLDLVLSVEPELIDTDQQLWLARLEAEHDNLRVAVEWGLAADDPERGRRLAAGLLWFWYLHGHTNEGIEYLQRAIERAPDDRSTVHPTLYAGVAAVSVASGQFDLMLDYSLRGLELATAIGDEENRASCLLLLGVAQSYMDIDAARDVLDQAAQAADAAVRAPRRRGVGRFVGDRVVVMHGVLHAYRDQHDEARPLLQEGYDRCLRGGDLGFAAMALDYQVVAAVLRGELDLAEELATRAYEIARPRTDYYDVGVTTSHLAFVKGFRGEVEAGLRLLDPVVRSVEGARHRVYVPRLSQAMGRLSLLAGDFERSVTWYQRDVPDTGPMTDSLIAARSLPGLASALGRLGRWDEARDRAERGLALARKLRVPHLESDALEQLGLLAARDDPDQAEDLHHEALALRVDHGVHLFQIDSLDALAGLAARGESFAEATRLLAAGDAARAALGYPRPAIDRDDHARLRDRLAGALGDAGFADAWKEGAQLTLGAAVAYARRARGSRDRPSTGWASLTPTEIEVVRLVAEGLTNPEIGTRLFISRATVKTHLSHVYAKLGVTNRTELATLASQQLSGS